jgi:hypothetical protein
MENDSDPRSDPDRASLALGDALAARGRFTDALVLPPLFFVSLGVAIAAQLATSAVGIARQDGAGWLLLVGGWALLALVAGVQLWRFRRRNGAWVSGLAHRVVLGTGDAAAVTYALALGAVVWAALEGAGWVVAGSSLAGGAAYAWSGRRWWQEYRRDPATHARPVPRTVLAFAGGLAAIGAAVLLVAG